ncbi:MAG: DUF2891 family protein [Deltaproteobacteria bacterium]|nr:DUF2891 family protein [Deltaproteobacteria bacterium]
MTFDRTTWLIAAGDLIAEAIGRRDSQHAIFHGCYDWHSAVHGHWALLRIARVTGETRFADQALERLLPDRIPIEARLLRDQPAFEMPYGRAWFLRLAIEHAATGSTGLRAMADEVAASLVDRYRLSAPSPAWREYSSDSWALAQLAAYATATGNAELGAFTQHEIEANFLDAGDVPGFGDDRANPDFFSPRAGWLYLIATTQPRATLDRMVAAAALDERVLAPIDPIMRAAHHYGVNWSRAWMLHRLALLYPDQPLYRRAFDAHVAVGVRDHERGAGDYMAYGHWVTQFAVYALTEDAA